MIVVPTFSGAEDRKQNYLFSAVLTVLHNVVFSVMSQFKKRLKSVFVVAVYQNRVMAMTRSLPHPPLSSPIFPPSRMLRCQIELPLHAHTNWAWAWTSALWEFLHILFLAYHHQQCQNSLQYFQCESINTINTRKTHQCSIFQLFREIITLY